MWKVVPAVTKRLSRYNSSQNHQMRLFFSESFKLENAWNARLHSPILKKINVNDLFYELDNQFQHFALASALDIDLFVNAVHDDSYFDEVEDVVHKLRLSPEAINILPSTHHALVRLYMESNKSDDLIRILDDRLNYGIFADEYCSLLMMDCFIKAGNFKDAARVSALNMLQEDVSNPLIQYMSLYSCHKYLENPVPWYQEENETPEDDDDEVIKVRVRYIRNPYFDDHFDLTDPKHLIGKTLTFIGSEIDDPIGRSYKLLGLVLHDKHEEAKNYVETILKGKNAVLKAGLDLADKFLNETANSEKTSENSKALVSDLKELLHKVSSEPDLVVNDDLLATVEKRLQELISKNESTVIEKQSQIYKEWEADRGKLLMEQIAKINREKQLAEVQRQKQLLQEKEEELFFFENEDKLDLIIEEKEKKKEEQRLRERKKEVKKEDPKTLAKKKKEPPPEPPLDDFFDENIPMKLINTKL